MNCSTRALIRLDMRLVVDTADVEEAEEVGGGQVVAMAVSKAWSVRRKAATGNGLG